MISQLVKGEPAAHDLHCNRLWHWLTSYATAHPMSSPGILWTEQRQGPWDGTPSTSEIV